MAKVTYHPEAGSAENTEQFGFVFEAGKATEVPDDSPHLSTLRENQFFKVEGGKKASRSADSVSGLKAVHVAGGRFVIKKDGEVVKEGLNKADADAFNGMSDEDKAEYVAA